MRLPIAVQTQRKNIGTFKTSAGINNLFIKSAPFIKSWAGTKIDTMTYGLL